MDVYVTDVRKSPYAVLEPVPLSSVKVVDTFWKPRLKTLVSVTLLHQYRMAEITGRLDNFRIASGRKTGKHAGLWFDDSDVYKIVEASAYALVGEYNRELYEKTIEVIADIASAQEEDGYLNTYFQVNKLERWVNLAWSHELYCAGHLIQAGIATKRALGDTVLYNAALKFANLIAETFGWSKLEAADGHPEVEIALVELYRETGDKKYLETAEFFIEFRGRGRVAELSKNPYLKPSPEHIVDHENIREMRDFTGVHAVRALYLFTAATDIYLETGDSELLRALERIWEKTLLKMYITGGFGSRHEGESFGEDYELPNDRAYSETCASVAGIMWAWRMFLAMRRPEYVDTIERVLYNAALAGISLDGTRFFYVNPLADYHARHERQPWFKCACCPPNIARLLAYLPEFIYAVSKREPEIWINLYIGSKATINLQGNLVDLTVHTDYPWSGVVDIRVEPRNVDEFTLLLRIPSWARESRVVVGEKVLEPVPGEYCRVQRVWDVGDTVRVDLSVKTRVVRSHPWIESNYGKIALVRGPLVYAVEEVDNEFDIRNLVVNPRELDLVEEYRQDVLGGVVVVKGTGYLLDTSNWKSQLYGDYTHEKVGTRVDFKAIPYYAWNNRGKTRMTVWIKTVDRQ